MYFKKEYTEIPTSTGPEQKDVNQASAEAQVLSSSKHTAAQLAALIQGEMKTSLQLSQLIIQDFLGTNLDTSKLNASVQKIFKTQSRQAYLTGLCKQLAALKAKHSPKKSVGTQNHKTYYQSLYELHDYTQIKNSIHGAFSINIPATAEILTEAKYLKAASQLALAIKEYSPESFRGITLFLLNKFTTKKKFNRETQIQIASIVNEAKDKFQSYLSKIETDLLLTTIIAQKKLQNLKASSKLTFTQEQTDILYQLLLDEGISNTTERKAALKFLEEKFVDKYLTHKLFSRSENPPSSYFNIPSGSPLKQLVTELDESYGHGDYLTFSHETKDLGKSIFHEVAILAATGGTLALLAHKGKKYQWIKKIADNVNKGGIFKKSAALAPETVAFHNIYSGYESGWNLVTGKETRFMEQQTQEAYGASYLILGFFKGMGRLGKRIENIAGKGAIQRNLIKNLPMGVGMTAFDYGQQVMPSKGKNESWPAYIQRASGLTPGQTIKNPFDSKEIDQTDINKSLIKGFTLAYSLAGSQLMAEKAFSLRKSLRTIPKEILRDPSKLNEYQQNHLEVLPELIELSESLESSARIESRIQIIDQVFNRTNSKPTLRTLIENLITQIQALKINKDTQQYFTPTELAQLKRINQLIIDNRLKNKLKVPNQESLQDLITLNEALQAMTREGIPQPKNHSEVTTQISTLESKNIAITSGTKKIPALSLTTSKKTQQLIDSLTTFKTELTQTKTARETYNSANATKKTAMETAQNYFNETRTAVSIDKINLTNIDTKITALEASIKDLQAYKHLQNLQKFRGTEILNFLTQEQRFTAHASTKPTVLTTDPKLLAKVEATLFEYNGERSIQKNIDAIQDFISDPKFASGDTLSILEFQIEQITNLKYPKTINRHLRFDKTTIERLRTLKTLIDQHAPRATNAEKIQKLIELDDIFTKLETTTQALKGLKGFAKRLFQTEIAKKHNQLLEEANELAESITDNTDVINKKTIVSYLTQSRKELIKPSSATKKAIRDLKNTERRTTSLRRVKERILRREDPDNPQHYIQIQAKLSKEQIAYLNNALFIQSGPQKGYFQQEILQDPTVYPQIFAYLTHYPTKLILLLEQSDSIQDQNQAAFQNLLIDAIMQFSKLQTNLNALTKNTPSIMLAKILFKTFNTSKFNNILTQINTAQPESYLGLYKHIHELTNTQCIQMYQTISGKLNAKTIPSKTTIEDYSDYIHIKLYYQYLNTRQKPFTIDDIDDQSLIYCPPQTIIELINKNPNIISKIKSRNTQYLIIDHLINHLDQTTTNKIPEIPNDPNYIGFANLIQRVSQLNTKPTQLTLLRLIKKQLAEYIGN